MNLADWYLNVQSPKDAVSILGLAPDHTEILYWKAYALHLSGDLSYTDVLHKAVSSSPEMVFPIGLQPSQYLSFLQNMWLPGRLNIFRAPGMEQRKYECGQRFI